MAGKKIGKDNIYIHLSAVTTLPNHLVARVFIAMELIKIREFSFIPFCDINFVITHPDHISLVLAEDFDKTHEPVLGDRYIVHNNGSVDIVGRPDKPRVLHQRYKTVKADYEGFDIEADKRREKWYRKYFTARDMCRAGYQHIWKEMLSGIGS